jgi:predicted RNA binding protein YcfA (HicA-like mRNA interferase family)
MPVVETSSGTIMAKIYNLLMRARRRKPLKFRELVTLLEVAGFVRERSQGTSHTIYKHPDIPGHMNIQSDGAEAKPYQVKLFLVMIDDAAIELTD